MPENTSWKTGLHIRLSREDGDKAESDSVVNQRSLLNDYIEEHPDFKLVDIYTDDGYTGINFDRPAFTRMIADLKTGKINCIIVKDLSRFGRDYIQTGNYLEQLLPFLNCRFISILDNLDSYERPAEISSVFVRFKHIMNDHYSHEISVKLRQSFDALREDGKLVSAYAPYGYKKDPVNKHHLIIDEEVADIVRDIFRWYYSSMGVVRIAQRLNHLGVTPPGLYRKDKGLHKGYNNNCGRLWRPNTIRDILGNKAYMGALDQKKYTTRDHKNRNRIHLYEDDRILVSNTHEPIIEEWLFEEVQRQFKSRGRTSPEKEKLYLFSGLLRCADCGGPMKHCPKKTPQKLYVYYKCKTYLRKSRSACGDSHSIRHDILEQAVLHAIRIQIQAVCDMKRVIDSVNELGPVKARTMDCSRQIDKLNRQIKNKTSLKQGLYEDWKAEIISRDEYIGMKAGYTEEIDRFTQAIHELEQEEKALRDMQTRNITWMESFARHGRLNQLNRELLLSLVDTIYIAKDQSIHIRFQYQDEYELIIRHVTKHIGEGEENEPAAAAH